MRDPTIDFLDFDAQALVDTLAGHYVYQHVVSLRGWRSMPQVQGGYGKGGKSERKATYLRWLSTTARAMYMLCRPKRPMVYAVRLFYILAFKQGFPGTSDWDNHVKAVQDAMVKGGVLPQDNLKTVGGTDGVWIVKAKEDLVWVGIR